MAHIKAANIYYDRRTLEEDTTTGGIKVKVSQGSPIIVTLNGLSIGEGTVTDAHIVSLSVSKLTKAVTLADGTVPFTGNQSMGGKRLTDVGLPTNATDAVNLDYLRRIPWKLPVRLATNANVDIITGGVIAIDGIATVLGDRILLYGQTFPANNGIYSVCNGQWIRTEDANTSEDLIAGAAFFVIEGLTNSKALFFLSTLGQITLGSTPLNFTKYAGSTTTTVTSRLQDFFLTALDISNKYVELSETPKVPEKVVLNVIHGTTQTYGYTFKMDVIYPRRVTWAGLGLDGILESGDILVVSYDT